MTVIEDVEAHLPAVPAWADGIRDTFRQNQPREMRLIAEDRRDQDAGFLLYEPRGGVWGTHLHLVRVRDDLQQQGIGWAMFQHMLDIGAPRPVYANDATAAGEDALKRWGFRFDSANSEWVFE